MLEGVSALSLGKSKVPVRPGAQTPSTKHSKSKAQGELKADRDPSRLQQSVAKGPVGMELWRGR